MSGGAFRAFLARARRSRRRMGGSWAPYAGVCRAREARRFFALACDAHARGEHGVAVEMFTEALRVDGRNQFALCNRALTRLAMGDGENALKDARTCVRNAPMWHKAWFRLGQARRAMGDVAEALNAFEEARRLSDGTGHEEDVDAVISELRASIEASDDGTLHEAVRVSEARREADVAEEEEEIERRREARVAKWDAKRAKRAVAEEELRRELGMEDREKFLSVSDVNTYLDDLTDSDDSELECYDGLGRACFIPRKITDFASITRRLRTSVGATATTDAMCELRRYGCMQISLGSGVAATGKFKAAADAMDVCALPYVVIPAWREATRPWPMALAAAHQDVQDVMWLMETVARVVTGAIYEDAGLPTEDLDRALDSPLFDGERTSAPEVDDVSPSALVLASDTAFGQGYAERTSALVRVDWLEAYEEEDARADGETTLVELSVCAELSRRVNGEFITIDELDPSDRDGHGVNGHSFACPRAKRPSSRALVSFFLCPVPARTSP